MKKRKTYCLVFLTLMLALALNAASASSIWPEAPEEKMTYVIDRGVSGLPGAEEVYLPYSAELFHAVSQINPTLAENLVIDRGVSAADIAAEEATEVYLAPTKVDDNTYRYYDENGALIAELVTEPEGTRSPEFTVSTRASTNLISGWSLAAGAYTHGDVNLDTTKAATYVYFHVFFIGNQRTYVGFYNTGTQTYTWFEPPKTESFRGNFLCATSHMTNFALKNGGNLPTTYDGAYSLFPIG